MSWFESKFWKAFWVVSWSEPILWKAFWVVNRFTPKSLKSFESWVNLNQIPENHFESWVDWINSWKPLWAMSWVGINTLWDWIESNKKMSRIRVCKQQTSKSYSSWPQRWSQVGGTGFGHRGKPHNCALCSSRDTRRKGKTELNIRRCRVRLGPMGRDTWIPARNEE